MLGAKLKKNSLLSVLSIAGRQLPPHRYVFSGVVKRVRATLWGFPVKPSYSHHPIWKFAHLCLRHLPFQLRSKFLAAGQRNNQPQPVLTV